MMWMKLLSLAIVVAVMKDAEIVQIGEPEDYLKQSF